MPQVEKAEPIATVCGCRLPCNEAFVSRLGGTAG
jgi:hypothetical protein